MSIGDLNRRLTLQAPLRAPDGGGGFETAWQDMAQDIPARVEALSGSESPRHGGLAATRRFRIVMRWRDDVTPALRLSENGYVYDIKSVRDPDGKSAWLEIIAEGG